MRKLFFSFFLWFQFISGFAQGDTAISLSGSLQITESGSAIYSLPLEVPPGTGGVTPGITITYNSQAGNGVMGTGWNIAGLSSISRSQQTYAQDNRNGFFEFDSSGFLVEKKSLEFGRSFTKSDRLSLDGVRLVLRDGPYSAGTSVFNDKYLGFNKSYKTEADEFMKIESIDTTADGSPRSFKVWTKDGRIMEYGSSDDSRIEASGTTIPMHWLVKKISDAKGNYIQFDYVEDNIKGSYYISKISYTGNANTGLLPYNEITFGYEGRNDIIVRNTFGSRNIIDRRLQKVTVRNEGEIAREYKFLYSYSNHTGNSFLLEIQGCYGGNHCPRALRMNNYQPGAYFPTNSSLTDDYFIKRTRINPIDTSDLKSSPEKQILRGDWNGDGFDDILVFWRETGITKFYTIQRDSFLFDKPIFNAIITDSLKGRFVKTSDFNADGFTDIVYYDTATGYNRFLINNYYENEKLSFYFNQDSALKYGTRLLLNGGTIPATYFKGSDKEITISDFDNDGLPDIMVYSHEGYIKHHNPSDTTLRRAVWLVNNGVYNTTRHQTHNNKEIIGFKNYGNQLYLNEKDSSLLIPIDLNGDNFTDILKSNPFTGENIVFPQMGKSSDEVFSGHFNFPSKHAVKNPVDTVISRLPQSYMDVNGDGLIDLYFKSPISAEGLSFINKGNGRFDTTVLSVAFSDTLKKYQDVEFVDLNGDGRADFLTFDSSKNAIYVSVPFIDSSKSHRTVIGNIIAAFYSPFAKEDLKPGSIIFTDAASRSSRNDFFIIDPVTGRNTFYSLRGMLFQNRDQDIIPPPQEDLVTRFRSAQPPYNEAEVIYTALHYADQWNYSNYSHHHSKNTYPYILLRENLTIAKSISVPGGHGGLMNREIVYRYENLRTNLLGRGFQGFEKISSTDYAENWSNALTSRKFTRNDSLAFLFANDPVFQEELVAIQFVPERLYNRQIKEKKVILDNPVLPTSFSTYNSREIQYSYELNGTLTDSIIHRTKIDDFGNVIYQVTDFGEGSRDSLQNSYSDNLSIWHLGRLTKAQLFRFSPGKSTIVKTSSFEYDPFNGMLTKEIAEPDNTELRYEKRLSYDTYGNLLNTEVTAINRGSNESRIWQQTFDTKGRFILTKTNPLGHQTKYTYEGKYGNIVTATDENGLNTSYNYDVHGRKVKELYPDGNWTSWTYKKGPNSSNPLFIQTDYSNAAPKRNDFNRGSFETTTRKVGFSGKNIFTFTYYADNALPAVEVLPYFQSTPEDSLRQISFQTDLLGRPAETIFPNGTSEKKIYTGRTTEELNTLGQKKSWKINGRELTTEVIDNKGNKLLFEYDAAGNHTKTTDPKGNTWFFEYDLKGRKTKIVDPDLGTTIFKYNGFDELISETNARDQETTYEYDKLGRVIKRTSIEGITIFTYDNGNKAIGKLSSVAHPNQTKVFAYDNLGRLALQTETIKGKTFSIGYSYDTGGRLEKIKYPTGLEVKYVYNAYGYLTEVRRVSDNYPFWKALKMNALDEMEEEEFGNGFKTYHFWNHKNATLDSTYTSKAGVYAQSFGFVFDALNNLTSRTNKKYNKREDFFYDDLNRLVKAQIAGQDTLVMTYDDLGNITTKSDVGNYFYGSVNNGPHRVVRIEKFKNICIPSEEVDAEYTSFNKVQRLYKDTISELKLSYGSDNQRVYQELYQNNILRRRRTYIANLFEQETRGDTTINNHYIRIGGNIIAVFTTTNKGKRAIHYWHKDHLGSLTSITDSSGNVVQELSFDAWGKRRNKDWTVIATSDTTQYLTDRGFTTHEHYDLFDLVDMNGRIYDAVIGRFLSADPFIDDIGNLQSYNRYSYVGNNPLSYTDPSGFIRIKIKAPKISFKSFGKALKSIVPEKMREWVKENWKQIAVTVVAVGVGVLTAGAGTAILGPSLWAAMAAGAVSGFATGVAATLIYGGNMKDALKAGYKGAIIGAVSAGFSYGVGSAGQAVQNLSGSTVASTATRMAGHAVTQGAMAKYQGGRFSDGFWSGAVSAGAEPFTNSSSKTMKVFSSAAVGGTTSTITGGKFANGAISGAYTSMFKSVGEELIEDMNRTSRREALEREFNERLKDGKLYAQNDEKGTDNNEDIRKEPVRKFYFKPENPLKKIRRLTDELSEKYFKKQDDFEKQVFENDK